MNKTIFCTHCGTANKYGNRFCTHCGAQLVYDASKGASQNQQQSRRDSVIDNATRTINNWTGENSSVPINLRSFFKQVWKSHSQSEAENIFIAGTPSTTPSLSEVSSNPVQPWLYSRVFIGLAFSLLLIAILNYLGINLQVAFMAILSISVPLTLMIFFFEINVFKNISLYLTIKICLIGGLFSLIVTLIIYMIVGTNSQFDIFGSTLVGLVEESGKALVGYYFVSKLRLSHIFNGMLVGGAIGAGFAAFENIEYATASNSEILEPLIRSVGSLGSHAIWCAITVSAIVLVNGNQPLTFQNINNWHFARFFLLAVVLHSLWDLQTPFTYVKILALICVGWIVLFVLIHTGLREVQFIQNHLTQDK